MLEITEVRSGFYNAFSGDSPQRAYDADDLSSIFDGIVTDGVFRGVGDEFRVTVGTLPNELIIGTGRGWFGHRWVRIDSKISVILNSANGLSDRKDYVLIKIDRTTEGRMAKIVVAEVYSDSDLPSDRDDGMITYHKLYYITRKAGSGSNLDENNLVRFIGKGTGMTPYAGSIIEIDDQHTHDASSITGGTFGGIVKANSGVTTDIGARIRNISLSSSDPGVGAPIGTNEILLVYEP